MSTSPEEASRGHDCGSLDGNCNCCACCNNLLEFCTCCNSCEKQLDMCACEHRMRTIWTEHHCKVCDSVYDKDCNEEHSVFHSSGVPCPNCCFLCKYPRKEFRECKCCRVCLIPHPCICDREQQNAISVEKRKNARYLIRCFLRKVISQKRSYFPVNTATLITFSNE